MIGPNGAGKTTLFRMIVGDEKPDAGALASATPSTSPTSTSRRDALDPDKTVWEEISDGYEHIKVGDREINSRAYVAGFNFKGSDQQRKVGVLSGGERNRVHLAKLLRRGGNVLLLDEPTNDLDVDTLRALEEALLAFPGCAVIISHDRWFLDRVATHVLAFEGDSQVLVRGQLRGLRGAPPRAARRRGRPAAPDHLQEARQGLDPRRECHRPARRREGMRRPLTRPSGDGYGRLQGSLGRRRKERMAGRGGGKSRTPAGRGRLKAASAGALLLVLVIAASGCIAIKSQSSSQRAPGVISLNVVVCASDSDRDVYATCDPDGTDNGAQNTAESDNGNDATADALGQILVSFRVPVGTTPPDTFSSVAQEVVFSRSAELTARMKPSSAARERDLGRLHLDAEVLRSRGSVGARGQPETGVHPAVAGERRAVRRAVPVAGGRGHSLDPGPEPGRSGGQLLSVGTVSPIRRRSRVSPTA